MKIIELLVKLANGEEVPKDVMYENCLFSWDNEDKDYYCEDYGNLFEYLFYEFQTNEVLNKRVDIVDISIIEKQKVFNHDEDNFTGIKMYKDGNEIISMDYSVEEDKDIPLIPDDELHEFNMKEKTLDLDKLNYNFKVLEQKINQVVKEFNEYRKENE